LISLFEVKTWGLALAAFLLTAACSGGTFPTGSSKVDPALDDLRRSAVVAIQLTPDPVATQLLTSAGSKDTDTVFARVAQLRAGEDDVGHYVTAYRALTALGVRALGIICTKDQIGSHFAAQIPSRSGAPWNAVVELYLATDAPPIGDVHTPYLQLRTSIPYGPPGFNVVGGRATPSVTGPCPQRVASLLATS
jgi:hypothetical protein